MNPNLSLQDNVKLAVDILSPHMPLLGLFATVRWATIIHFLLALLLLPFSVLWEQVPFSGFGLMSRVVATIAASRLLRVVCFMSTVLPNPQPGCYQRRFPPVPDSTWEIIKAGYTTIRGAVQAGGLRGIDTGIPLLTGWPITCGRFRRLQRLDF